MVPFLWSYADDNHFTFPVYSFFSDSYFDEGAATASIASSSIISICHGSWVHCQSSIAFL